MKQITLNPPIPVVLRLSSEIDKNKFYVAIPQSPDYGPYVLGEYQGQYAFFRATVPAYCFCPAVSHTGFSDTREEAVRIALAPGVSLTVEVFEFDTVADLVSFLVKHL